MCQVSSQTCWRTGYTCCLLTCDECGRPSSQICAARFAYKSNAFGIRYTTQLIVLDPRIVPPQPTTAQAANSRSLGWLLHAARRGSCNRNRESESGARLLARRRVVWWWWWLVVVVVAVAAANSLRTRTSGPPARVLQLAHDPLAQSALGRWRVRRRRRGIRCCRCRCRCR